MAYVEYDFFGERFITECVQQTTFSPVFDYTHIHHIPSVTPEFIKWLQGSVEMQIHVTQNVKPPTAPISTNNETVVESIMTGEAKGYEKANQEKPVSEAEMKVQQLTEQLAVAYKENEDLKKKIEELETEVASLKSPRGGKKGKKIKENKDKDKEVNG